jgi:hypothetical protein
MRLPRAAQAAPKATAVEAASPVPRRPDRRSRRIVTRRSRACGRAQGKAASRRTQRPCRRPRRVLRRPAPRARSRRPAPRARRSESRWLCGTTAWRRTNPPSSRRSMRASSRRPVSRQRARRTTGLHPTRASASERRPPWPEAAAGAQRKGGAAGGGRRGSPAVQAPSAGCGEPEPRPYRLNHSRRSAVRLPDLTECVACGAVFEEGLFAAGAVACGGCGAEFCPECALREDVGDDCPRCRDRAAPAGRSPSPE